MKHSVLYKREGYYSAHPVPYLLPDGRLAIALNSSPFADHFCLGEWIVLVSDDKGETFERTDDPAIPLTWPGANTRERYDRFADSMADGSYVAAGTVGFEVWSKERREEAKAMGLYTRDHPNLLGEEIVVGMPKLFVQRSRDSGQTWERREWFVPGFSWMTAFPRGTQLRDGSILAPVYVTTEGMKRWQTFAFRGDPTGEEWRLYPMASSISGLDGDELCFFEVEPGNVLALIRHGSKDGHRAYPHLLASWSHDGGRTWSQPLRTEIQGYPPNICRLEDGRLLCCVTYRWQPMGIRAVLSEDNGRTWDVDNTIILRDDSNGVCTLWPDYRTRSGGSDVGYPCTVQFEDGTLFTCYWITHKDGITHAAATKWRIEELLE